MRARRLAEMVAAAHIVQAKRKPTRPSRAAKAQRVETKRQRSAVKQGRGKVTDFLVRHREERSDVAIQLDCFASLAMTEK